MHAEVGSLDNGKFLITPAEELGDLDTRRFRSLRQRVLQEEEYPDEYVINLFESPTQQSYESRWECLED